MHQAYCICIVSLWIEQSISLGSDKAELNQHNKKWSTQAINGSAKHTEK